MTRTTDNEEWRPVPSAPYFEASSLGRVRRPGGNIIDGYVRADGRIHVKQYIRKDHTPDGRRISRYRSHFISRLVCEAFNGPPPTPQHVAAHLDHNPGNNRPTNLAWQTQLENLKAMSDANRGVNGATALTFPPSIRSLVEAHTVAIETLRTAYRVSEAETRRICNGARRGMAPPP